MRGLSFGIAALAGVVLLLAGTLVVAQMNDDVIMKRQGVMKDMGKTMGGLSAIVKGEKPFDAKTVQDGAALLQDHARMIPTVFEAKVTEGKTDAKAEIWGMMGDFKAKAQKLEEAAGGLTSVMSQGDLGNAVKAVGGTCGGCHREYRKPKEESYKNM